MMKTAVLFAALVASTTAKSIQLPKLKDLAKNAQAKLLASSSDCSFSDRDCAIKAMTEIFQCYDDHGGFSMDAEWVKCSDNGKIGCSSKTCKDFAECMVKAYCKIAEC